VPNSTFIYSLVLSLFLVSSAFAADQPVASDVKSRTTTAKQPEKPKMKEVTGEAVGQVDGIKLDKDADKPEKEGFTIGDLNPFKWIFKPVTDTQKEVRKLSKQITKMETPITSLQKPMVGLRQDMVTVSGQMGGIRDGITDVNGKMHDVNGSLGRVEHSLNKIYTPVVKLKEPVVEMAKPVRNMHGNIQTLRSDMHGMKEVVSFTSTAILVAVLGIGALVVIGTPIAGLLVWKHRSTIMRKLGGTQQDVNEMQREGRKAKRAAGVD